MHISRNWSHCTALVAAALLVGAALGAQTDFNGFAEGWYGLEPTFDGITFFDAELVPGNPVPFAIDDTTDHWLEYPQTLPYADGSVMKFIAYDVGPTSQFSYSAVGSFKMTTGQIESYGAISVVYLVEAWFPPPPPPPPGLSSREIIDFRNNTVTLEALLDGNVVASDSANLDNLLGYESMDPLCAFGASRLEVSGVEFDTLRVVSAGPANGGYLLGCLDNVVISPEPGALSLIGLGGLSLRRRRGWSK